MQPITIQNLMEFLEKVPDGAKLIELLELTGPLLDVTKVSKDIIHELLNEALFHNWDSFSQIVETMDNLL